MWKRKTQAIVLAFVTLTGGSAAHAALSIWDGGDLDDSNFSSADNWDFAPTSASDTDLQFAGTTRLDPVVDVNNPWIVHSITINTGAGEFVIGGNDLHFQGTASAITNKAATVQTFNNNLRFGGGGNRTVSADPANIVLNGGIVVDSGTTMWARGGKDVVVHGRITGAGGVSRTDSGTLYLNDNTNSFTGNLSAAHGVIAIGSIADAGVASAAGAGSQIVLGQPTWGPSDAGTIRYTGATASTNRGVYLNSGLLQNGQPFSGRATLEVTDANTTLTFNSDFAYAGSSTYGQWRLWGAGHGVINGNITTTGARLEKNGAGTWTLNGTNGYTGITEVKGGKLLVNGSIVSDTTVSANATLGGDGTISANAIVNAGGTMAAGNSVGTLTVTGNTTLAGTLKTELDGATTDLLIVGGALDITAATVDFDVLTTLTGGPYVFATYGSLVGTQFATVTDLPTGYTIDYAYGGDSIALVTVIPSPSALNAGLLALAILAARRRR